MIFDNLNFFQYKICNIICLISIKSTIDYAHNFIHNFHCLEFIRAVWYSLIVVNFNVLFKIIENWIQFLSIVNLKSMCFSLKMNSKSMITYKISYVGRWLRNKGFSHEIWHFVLILIRKLGQTENFYKKFKNNKSLMFEVSMWRIENTQR